MSLPSARDPGAISQLASFIAGYPTIADQRALHASRRALADTFGCMLGGAHLAATTSVRNGCAAWGDGLAPVVGAALKLAPPFAALVNGTAAHALDYDDYDVPANGHPSAVIFPALLAASSMRGPAAELAAKPVNGRDLLDAHVVGVEIMLRLGEAMNLDHYKRGWHTTMTFGSLAAAGACARLRQFDAKTAGRALSLAASMASGLTNQGGYGAKAAHAGMAAMNGVMAAQLAAAGLSASPHTVDGPLSMATAMGTYQGDKFAAALGKLGSPLAILEYGLIAKPYPACSYTHRIIDAALAIRERCGGSVPLGSVGSVSISVPDFYLDLLTFSSPSTPAQAMFSAEYAVARSLIDGRFDLSSLAPASLQDRAGRELLPRCKVKTRRALKPDLTLDPDDPDRVEVRFSNGEEFAASVALPRGAPSRPLADDDLWSKFEDCAREVIAPQLVRASFDTAMALDEDSGPAGLWAAAGY